MKKLLPYVAFFILLLIPIVDQNAFAGAGVDEDKDNDGFSTSQGDCNDSASSCTTDCSDNDGDGIAECLDRCIDADLDNYGLDTNNMIIGSGLIPVGACTTDGNTPCTLFDNQCIAPDCNDSNPLLNLICEVQHVGGKIIPIKATSLLLAGAQSFSWMLPLALSGIGIGMFIVSRKSKNL